ncbi:MAG TPA: LytTR family DNA-binding domain-containing protein [Firmicutes bacterium]|nr:LytTR family DNA-binding domain-containing protein [Bacillota bacterium]
MFKVAICDDDVSYRKSIRNLIAANDTLCRDVLFYEYSSGEELLADIGQMHNLLFLDIQMPGIDGNETAKAFRNVNKEAVLVFCTNYQDPTPESFKVQPYRYIMKDLYNQMAKEEMSDIIQEMIGRKNVQYLNITEDGQVYRIPINQILYISVIKRGSAICYYPGKESEKLFCRQTVKELYFRLSGEGFEYAHNSYIVNMANIIRVTKNVIMLKDRTELNISRSKQKNFDDRFSDFLRLRYKRK